jgi:hypothetical protein
VLDGAVPHRDFLTFYGPGNLWVVASAFELFGAEVAVERAVGLLYRVLVVLSVFALARRFGGLAAAALAAIVAAVLMAEEVIWAYSTYGAIAFGVLALAVATSAVVAPAGRRQDLALLAAGAAGGLAVLMRFDFAPAVVVSALPLLTHVPRRVRVWYGVGFLGLASLYVPHLAVVGPAKIEQVARDLVASSDERSFPVPRPWEYPGTLLAATAIATAALVLTGALLARRRRGALEARVLLAAGLFSACLLPYALSRPDDLHVVPLATVPLALLPGLAVFLARTPRARPAERTGLTISVVVATVVLVQTLGDPDLRRFRVGDPPRIENAGRTFYVDDDSLPAQEVVTLTERLSRDGESLFVGPQDLRVTDYSPTYLYFLFPKLVPASYYMEMNPDTASRADSGLADEIRGADWLILTSEFQGEDWWGPNATPTYGSAEPNAVVRRLFCLRLESGDYRLYGRCSRA